MKEALGGVRTLVFGSRVYRVEKKIPKEVEEPELGEYKDHCAHEQTSEEELSSVVSNCPNYILEVLKSILQFILVYNNI